MADSFLRGRLEINRSEGGEAGRHMVLRVVDEDSHVIAFEAHISLEAFMLALTSAPAACGFHLNDSGAVGKLHEAKEEIVPLPAYSVTAAQVRKAVAPFEKDGWEARISDAQNAHRISHGKEGYIARVTFTRHVPRPPAKCACDDKANAVISPPCVRYDRSPAGRKPGQCFYCAHPLQCHPSGGEA